MPFSYAYLKPQKHRRCHNWCRLQWSILRRISKAESAYKALYAITIGNIFNKIFPLNLLNSKLYISYTCTQTIVMPSENFKHTMCLRPLPLTTYNIHIPITCSSSTCQNNSDSLIMTEDFCIVNNVRIESYNYIEQIVILRKHCKLRQSQDLLIWMSIQFQIKVINYDALYITPIRI